MDKLTIGIKVSAKLSLGDVFEGEITEILYGFTHMNYRVKITKAPEYLKEVIGHILLFSASELIELK
jgi:hypothetical protein